MRFLIPFVMLSNLQIVKADLVDRLDGVWEGEGRQAALTSTTGAHMWTIRFTAENGLYLIEYPSSPCSGT